MSTVSKPSLRVQELARELGYSVEQRKAFFILSKGDKTVTKLGCTKAYQYLYHARRRSKG